MIFGKALAGLVISCALPGIALGGTNAVPPAPSAAAPAPPPYAPPPGYPVYPLQQGYPPPGYYPPPNAYPGYPLPQRYRQGAYTAAERLTMLDFEIQQLEAQRARYTLGPPLALMIAGAVVASVGLVVVGSSSCDTSTSASDVSCQSNAEGLGILVFAGGVVLATIGTVQLIIRSAKRSHVGHQIAARQLEVEGLRGLGRPRVDFVPTHSGGGVLTLALDF
jgi:hypothetical protein